MFIFLCMLIIGFLLGFIGAGGSGFIISILTTFFGIPIHLAIGTSLSAMVFTSLSGAYSHYRENNVVIPIGLTIGLFSVIGAYLGAHISKIIPEVELIGLTAAMMFLSAFLLWLRIFTNVSKKWGITNKIDVALSFKFLFLSCGIGLITGMLSGVFGIGSASFIQIGLLLFFGLSVEKSVGTTMFIIVPIALVGGISYYMIGNLDLLLLIKVATATLIGAYIGAKFTVRVKLIYLKIAIVFMPTIGGILLFLRI